MYQNAGMAAGAGTAGGLAMTGTNPLWIVLAGFALLAAGSAFARVMPKFRRSEAR